MCFTSSKIRAFSDNTIFVNDAEIGNAVQASCSFPTVFSPCDYENIKLVDGGIRENVPWKELKALGSDKVLSIVFEETDNSNCEKDLIEVASRSISLLCRELSNYELNGADYIIKIRSEKIGLLDMSKIDELYELGYEQVKKDINRIRVKLNL